MMTPLVFGGGEGYAGGKREPVPGDAKEEKSRMELTLPSHLGWRLSKTRLIPAGKDLWQLLTAVARILACALWGLR